MAFDLRTVRGTIRTCCESSSGAVRRWHARFVLLSGAALAGFGMALMPVSAYALPVCPHGTGAIKRCCKIITSGSDYDIGSDIYANGSYDACIKIKAGNVLLNGENHTITGLGPTTTMKGVVVEPGANGASLQNFTYINGFATSVEVDANYAYLNGPTGDGSDTGVVINGNHTVLYNVGGNYNIYNGIVINGRGTLGYSVGGSFNGWNGVVINSTAVGTYIWHSVDSANDQSGLKIKAVTSGFFPKANSTQNGTYGIWLRGSHNISLLDFFAYENTIAGVYLGCHAHGPVDRPCPPGTPKTNANLVGSSNFVSSTPTATANGGGVQQYGVVIDIGNHLNHVQDVWAAGNTVDNGYDGNPGCGGNLWWNDNLPNPAYFVKCPY